MSKAEKQIEAVERLLERQRTLIGSGYADAFITVSVEEVVGAMNDGAAEWDARQVGVIPADDSNQWEAVRLRLESGETTPRKFLEQAGFDEEYVAAFIKEYATCPECMQGKHGNCDGTALSEDDEIVECHCHAGGHGE